jgi:hypothetical protein
MSTITNGALNNVPSPGGNSDVLAGGDDVFTSCLSWSPCSSPYFSADMDTLDDSMPQISSLHPYTFSDPMFDFSMTLPFLKPELPDSPPLLPALLPASAATVLPVSSGLDRSLAILKANSHAIRLHHVQQVQGDKGTGDTYERRVNSYERWWSSDQL